MQWFEHFVRFVKLSKKIQLLTLDGHYSHSTNTEVIDCAQENGAHNVFLPPHRTHKLQRLDVSFLQPLKTYYA
jgi:4-hydroxybenzoate polyprenyltransferase